LAKREIYSSIRWNSLPFVGREKGEKNRKGMRILLRMGNAKTLRQKNVRASGKRGGGAGH